MTKFYLKFIKFDISNGRMLAKFLKPDDNVLLSSFFLDSERKKDVNMQTYV